MFVQFLILFIPLLLARVQFHFSDVESFINNVSRIDKNRDYDRDGKTETTKHCGHLGKSHLIIFKESPMKVECWLPTISTYTSFPEFKVVIPDTPILVIFRPPASAV